MVEPFSLLVGLFSLWSHLKMRRAEHFARILAPHAEFGDIIKMPVVRHVGGIDKRWLVFESGTAMEQIVLDRYWCPIAIEETARYTWDVEIYKMCIGVGHFSEVVVYTEPVLTQRTYVYIGPGSTTHNPVTFDDIFDGKKWRDNETK
jgi:hypothetical protein